jgi:16S rRNA (cytosine967-C5)-methyltransferase
MTATGTRSDTARRLALEALVRIDEHGAYANLVLRGLLDGSALDRRDRAFATELVYGVTRQRRALDFLIDRFLVRTELDPPVRAALRLGAYQLHFLDTPAHAAVSATVSVAPRRARSLVNAVLRRLADRHDEPVDWPDVATHLSYPDWIVERLVNDLGEADAIAALRQMNEPATLTVRADGYVQDEASQWVAAAVDAQTGELVIDLCAAPGGKTTALAATGARVVAADRRLSRAGLVAASVRRLHSAVTGVVAADGRRSPFRPSVFDRVLVDAPCTGLGALRRRPDARWRVLPGDVARLAELQLDLVKAAAELVAPGGVVVYSVCTLTADESLAVDAALAAAHPELEPLPPPVEPWRPWGRGALLLPQAAGTDGMAILVLRARR